MCQTSCQTRRGGALRGRVAVAQRESIGAEVGMEVEQRAAASRAEVEDLAAAAAAEQLVQLRNRRPVELVARRLELQQLGQHAAEAARQPALIGEFEQASHAQLLTPPRPRGAAW